MRARPPKACWTVLAGLLILLAAGRADAQNQCMNDLDCPGTECGGQVCTRSSGAYICSDPHTAGASGINDGWCGDANGNPLDANCKCRGMGARCDGFYCTFTIPSGGGGSSGTGGATGAAGSGTGAAGSGAAGASGGTSAGSGDGGGCSVGRAKSRAGVVGAALLLFSALARRRGRRRG